MSDETAKAWNRIAKSLVSQLPGEWTTGRSGIRTILVRKPVDWVLVWAGVDRSRRDSDPFLIGGQVQLVDRFQFTVGHGIRSDQLPDHPSKVDLTDPTATEVVRAFITEGLLPRLDQWTPDRLAAEAEDQLAIPDEERGRPLDHAGGVPGMALIRAATAQPAAEADPEKTTSYLLSVRRRGRRFSIVL